MLTENVVAHFGSYQLTAKALGIQRAAVYRWKKKGMLPPLRAAQVDKLTGGKLKFDPDDYATWYSKLPEPPNKG